MDSRIEEILKEKVGDPYEEVPLMSRIEILLDRLSSSADSSAYAHSLELSINSQTYVLTATLKNTSDEILGTPQTIDLPLESMVVNGTYDNTTKKVILTLKNGNTVDFSVADLVEGLQSEITSSNKLNSDLVDDTNQNNKFVTSAEKTKIANALTSEEYNAGKTTPSGTTYTIGGTTYTVRDNAEVFNDYSNNKAIGDYSHAEGYHTTALGNLSHAEGGSTTASGNLSHAEGGGTTASGDSSHAEGANTTASGINSHAEGGGTTASGMDSHAEGGGCRADGADSHAEGTVTIASSASQHVQGKYNIEDSNDKYAFIIGNGTDNNNRSNAFAVDWDGLIYVNNASTGVDVSRLLTEETYNAGKQVTTNNKTGEIFNNYTNNQATGNYSHAEGSNATASGDYSHAEGGAATASGNYSHAEGDGTTASGEISHAEGLSTIASGDYSHAEGTGTTASGDYSHAEGHGTTANGRFSHVEGYGSVANGNYSHADGYNTIANTHCQHVLGKCNIADSNSSYAFIIGNGTDSNNRSNAFAVDWDGLIYVNNSATGVDVSNLATRLTAVETTIGNINAVLEEVL